MFGADERREDVIGAPELRHVFTAIEDTRKSCGCNDVTYEEIKEILLHEFGINEVSQNGNSGFIEALRAKEDL